MQTFPLSWLESNSFGSGGEMSIEEAKNDPPRNTLPNATRSERNWCNICRLTQGMIELKLCGHQKALGCPRERTT
jgi:hypothetical protein